MFEVGKKYKSNNFIGLVIEVLYATDRNAFLRVVEHSNSDYVGVETTYSQDKYVQWEEYKEPRTITRWVNVYEVNGELSMGPLWGSKEKAIHNSGYAIGYKDTIPITYTEPS